MRRDLGSQGMLACSVCLVKKQSGSHVNLSFLLCTLFLSEALQRSSFFFFFSLFSAAERESRGHENSERFAVFSFPLFKQ